MEVCELSASFFQSAFYDNSSEIDGYPFTLEPIWVLGSQYSLIHDRDELENDVKSRILFTYRKGFGPIGGSGPTSDVGWGCMLRCGQMMLAQALINRHLSRVWRWEPGAYDPRYYEILRLFQDRKDGCYSIHQIASMGASEGKPVGEWFGPNTIAQVLRKLASYDRWSGVVIHIALDNTVIIDDIRELCVIENESATSSTKPAASPLSNSQATPSATHIPHNSKFERSNIPCGNSGTPQDSLPHHKMGILPENIPHCKMEILQENVGNFHSGTSNDSCSRNLANGASKEARAEDIDRQGCDQQGTALDNDETSGWRPLLLIIPLRLGLSEINPVYYDSFKACLALRQSVGVIGGKPSHAHWFIGYTENKLMYLDPHTCQPYVDVLRPDFSDSTFHATIPRWVDISQIDPSIAVGFYCNTLADFESLCESLRQNIAQGRSDSMFELRNKRPSHFPPAHRYDASAQGATGVDFTVVDSSPRQMDSEDEFELV